MKRMLLTIFFAVCLTAAPALAGPPLVCHAIDIGTATSLPWSSGSGWNGAQGSYDLSHLGDDMFALLTPAMPIDVRRETLRRAVIYSASEPSLADTLTRRLVAKANDAQAAGKPDPLAWFDAGYFVATRRQAAALYPMLRSAEEPDGLAWIEKAIAMGGRGMEPAAALVEAGRPR
jgi:hypothetical protein